MLRKYSLIIVFVFLFFFFSSKNTLAQQESVVINELGIIGDSDWFELYAFQDTDISGWYLDDKDTITTVYDFPQGTAIGPSSSVILFVQLPSGKNSRFNDSGDTISLYKPGQSDYIDQITYGGSDHVCLPSSSDGSVGRVADVITHAPLTNVWDRFSESSPNKTNEKGILASCPSPTPIPTSSPTNTPSPTHTPTPTNTPTPSPTPSVKPTSTPTIGPSPTKKPTPTSEDYSAQNQEMQTAADVSQFRYDSNGNPIIDDTKVLGASESSDPKNENISPFAYVLLGLGVVFIIVSIFLFIRHKNDTASGVE